MRLIVIMINLFPCIPVSTTEIVYVPQSVGTCPPFLLSSPIIALPVLHLDICNKHSSIIQRENNMNLKFQ